MHDIETYSTRPSAAIISIGAVAFDPCGHDNHESITPDRKFYVNIDLRDQLEKWNRHIDPRTVGWWEKQDPAARAALNENQLALPEALEKYAQFVRGWDATDAWGYGAVFDNTIIEDAMKAVGIENPIGYRGQMCMRTMARKFPVNVRVQGTLHNALDDAVNQVIHLQAIFRRLYFSSVDLSKPPVYNECYGRA